VDPLVRRAEAVDQARHAAVRQRRRIDVEGLVFDTPRITILIAMIICAGATPQAVEMLGEHLVDQGAIIDPVFGRRLLSVVLLVILAAAPATADVIVATRLPGGLGFVTK